MFNNKKKKKQKTKHKPRYRLLKRYSAHLAID